AAINLLGGGISLRNRIAGLLSKCCERALWNCIKNYAPEFMPSN
ncbi:MAG: hypothetical protein ACI91F_003026, partial [Candidatus Binatia bacterium]